MKVFSGVLFKKERVDGVRHKRIVWRVGVSVVCVVYVWGVFPCMY